jgi:hypothetical protein
MQRGGTTRSCGCGPLASALAQGCGPSGSGRKGARQRCSCSCAACQA